MMRDWKETADVSGFVISLFLGFYLAFKTVLPVLGEVDVEVMRYLCALGLGFGLGICFYLIFTPAHALLCLGHQKLMAWIEKREKATKTQQKGEDDGA